MFPFSCGNLWHKCLLACGSNTIVEQKPHYPKFEGLDPDDSDTGRQKTVEKDIEKFIFLNSDKDNNLIYFHLI